MANPGARCGDEVERLRSESTSTSLCQTSEFYTAIGASSCTDNQYESSTSIQDQGDGSSHCLQNLHDRAKSDLEIEIDASKVHWSELSSESSLDEEAESNREMFEKLRERPEYSWLFGTSFSTVEVGPKIAEGGQAEIFQGTVKSSMTGELSEARCVLKVFKAGFSLRDLQRQWPKGVVKGWSLKDGSSSGFNHWSYLSRVGLILGGVVLEDDRFAFVLAREDIDLRKFIDVYQDKESFSWGIQTKTLEDFRAFHPHRCTYEWDEGKGGLNAFGIIYDIALGMRSLHRCNILHRDLKASNVLISDGYIPGEGNTELADGWKMIRPIRVLVADFECSIGVVGTGFWRAPEILRQLKEGKKKVNFTCEADVYSFAMTCYEVLTGDIPFEGYSWTDYDVLSEVRPTLPKALPIWIKSLIERCWHPCPTQRPTFKNIVEEIEEHIKNDNSYRFKNTIDAKEHRHRATIHAFIFQH